ncbi:MAG: hypothetical protein PHS73_01010 [Candidatus Peribacteraceae bacterium]|nr:hypothetical protein [Candidatus Peribacteraceae bacterium]
MELLNVAIVIVAIGALLWIGWTLAPFIFAILIVYFVIQYRREIPKVIRAFFAEIRRKKIKRP